MAKSRTLTRSCLAQRVRSSSLIWDTACVGRVACRSSLVDCFHLLRKSSLSASADDSFFAVAFRSCAILAFSASTDDSFFAVASSACAMLAFSASAMPRSALSFCTFLCISARASSVCLVECIASANGAPIDVASSISSSDPSSQAPGTTVGLARNGGDGSVRVRRLRSGVVEVAGHNHERKPWSLALAGGL